MNIPARYLKPILTSAVVGVAIVVVLLRYWDYVTNPWTRNGQVRAQVVQITPRVSAPIVSLPIADNQFVRTGDLLFEIDPRTFKAELDRTQAQLDETRDRIEALKSQVDSAKAAVDQYRSLIAQSEAAIDGYKASLDDARASLARVNQAVAQGAVSRDQADETKAQYDVALARVTASEAQLIQARARFIQALADLAEKRAKLGAPGEQNAQLRSAKAAVRAAELDLDFTRVVAPVDGYVTNLDLRLGDQAVANQPALALVDVNSYWIDGYFRETLVGSMRSGDRAIVTLMSYPDTPIAGRVESLGWGISQDDGSTGYELLPDIAPTFEWIRLAQRVPVRIQLEGVPSNVKLRVGTTASVLVMTGTAGKEADVNVPPVPTALQ